MSCACQDLKLKFYQLMIELDQHEGSYLAICKHYLAIYNTEQIQKDKDQMKDVRLLGSLLGFNNFPFFEDIRPVSSPAIAGFPAILSLPENTGVLFPA